MIVEDNIYGRFDIREPVLIELLTTPTVTRLKGVSQRGYPDFVEGGLPINYSRYEHSVGCMLLLRKLGADLEEQIAGLLHDVSHTAFSHVIDWAIGDPKKEDFQDRVLKEYINNSEIPGILKKHGFNPSKISEIEEMDHFKLMERPAPYLCVDRLDYSLRDIHYTLGKETEDMLEDLTTYNGKIIFKSEKMALKYAKLYASCNRKIWAGVDNVVRYYLLGNFIKKCLDDKVLTMQDFYKDEDYVIKKINKTENKELIKEMNSALGSLRYTLVKSGGINMHKKFRYIDPEFMSGRSVMKVTDVDPEYKKSIEKEIEQDKSGIFVKLGN